MKALVVVAILFMSYTTCDTGSTSHLSFSVLPTQRTRSPHLCTAHLALM